MGIGQLEILAPLLFAIILTLTVAGVILLKPIANKLGLLLEAMAKERQEPRLGEELGHIRELLETMNGRLTLMEERQDFTDALLNDPSRRSLRIKGAAEGGPEQPEA